MLRTIPSRACSKFSPRRAGFLIIPGIVLFFSTPLIFGQCGAPGFGSSGAFPTNAQPAAIAAGDFNSDGKIDLATAGGSANGGTVSILLGDGAGRFAAPSEFSLSSTATAAKNPRAIVAADFNRDGRLDLATANYASQNVSVLLGDGAGLFSRERTNVFPLGGSPNSIAAGDFNNDGKLDLLTTNPIFVKGGTVSVLFGDGAGRFGGSNGQPENSHTLPFDSPTSLATGDFDGDARQDFAVVSSHESTYPNVPTYVSIFLGDGRGGVAATKEFRVVTNRDQTVRSVGPHGIATADFNRDGRQDLVVGLTYMTFTYAGDGRGGFSLTSTFEHALSPSIAVGDFNGDAKPDLFRAHNGNGNVSVALGDGTGRFGAPANFPTAATSSDSVVGDFNGDGKHDLAGANIGANNVWVLLNTCSSSTPAKAPVLVVEELTNRVIAFDSVTMLGGSVSINSPYNLSSDRRTRLLLFVRDPEPTPFEFTSVVNAQIEDFNHVVYPLTVESVRRVPFFDWLIQVTVRMPDGLTPGTDVWISINVNGTDSNKAILSLSRS